MWLAEGLKATSWTASRMECCCASEQLKPCLNVILESHSTSWFKDRNVFLLLFLFSCRIINVLQPGSVRKINNSSQNWHQVIRHPQGPHRDKEPLALTIIPLTSLELPVPHSLYYRGQSQRTQREHLRTSSSQKDRRLWDRICLVMHQHANKNKNYHSPFLVCFCKVENSSQQAKNRPIQSKNKIVPQWRTTLTSLSVWKISINLAAVHMQNRKHHFII